MDVVNRKVFSVQVGNMPSSECEKILKKLIAEKRKVDGKGQR